MANPENEYTLPDAEVQAAALNSSERWSIPLLQGVGMLTLNTDAYRTALEGLIEADDGNKNIVEHHKAALAAALDAPEVERIPHPPGEQGWDTQFRKEAAKAAKYLQENGLTADALSLKNAGPAMVPPELDDGGVSKVNRLVDKVNERAKELPNVNGVVPRIQPYEGGPYIKLEFRSVSDDGEAPARPESVLRGDISAAINKEDAKYKADTVRPGETGDNLYIRIDVTAFENKPFTRELMGRIQGALDAKAQAPAASRENDPIEPLVAEEPAKAASRSRGATPAANETVPGVYNVDAPQIARPASTPMGGGKPAPIELDEPVDALGPIRQAQQTQVLADAANTVNTMLTGAAAAIQSNAQGAVNRVKSGVDSAYQALADKVDMAKYNALVADEVRPELAIIMANKSLSSKEKAEAIVKHDGVTIDDKQFAIEMDESLTRADKAKANVALNKARAKEEADIRAGVRTDANTAVDAAGASIGAANSSIGAANTAIDAAKSAQGAYEAAAAEVEKAREVLKLTNADKTATDAAKKAAETAKAEAEKAQKAAEVARDKAKELLEKTQAAQKATGEDRVKAEKAREGAEAEYKKAVKERETTETARNTAVVAAVAAGASAASAATSAGEAKDSAGQTKRFRDETAELRKQAEEAKNAAELAQKKAEAAEAKAQLAEKISTNQGTLVNHASVLVAADEGLRAAKVEAEKITGTLDIAMISNLPDTKKYGDYIKDLDTSKANAVQTSFVGKEAQFQMVNQNVAVCNRRGNIIGYQCQSVMQHTGYKDVDKSTYLPNVGQGAEFKVDEGDRLLFDSERMPANVKITHAGEKDRGTVVLLMAEGQKIDFKEIEGKGVEITVGGKKTMYEGASVSDFIIAPTQVKDGVRKTHDVVSLEAAVAAQDYTLQQKRNAVIDPKAAEADAQMNNYIDKINTDGNHTLTVDEFAHGRGKLAASGATKEVLAKYDELASERVIKSADMNGDGVTSNAEMNAAKEALKKQGISDEALKRMDGMFDKIRAAGDILPSAIDPTNAAPAVPQLPTQPGGKTQQPN